HHQVTVSDGTDRIVIIEMHDEPEAIVPRAHELAAELPPPLVVRAVDRFAAAFARRDWDALEACFAPGCTLEDRRTGVVTLPEASISDVIVDIARSYAALGDDVTWEVDHLAQAGDRVCATRAA